MRLVLAMAIVVLLHPSVIGQFPRTTMVEVRYGQLRPSITSIVQDEHGLLWLASAEGVLRTDGERVDMIARADVAGVTALHAAEGKVITAFGNGSILSCVGTRCDTLFQDDRLASSPVRSIAATNGDVWLGTYGAGIWIISNDSVIMVTSDDGLRDDHINDLKAFHDGSVVAATDQGIALVAGNKVIKSFGEAEGAPDNLVLSLAVTASGAVWAGTDRGIPFLWDPSSGAMVRTIQAEAGVGPIVSIAEQDGLVWIGVLNSGVALYDTRISGEQYRDPKAERSMEVSDMLLDIDGALWWCNGTEQLHRSDAAILMVQEHEGLDLRTVRAICADPSGRIWFANDAGIYHHSAAFSMQHTITRIPLDLDPAAPVVSMAATEDGTVWAATFGGGVIAISENTPEYFNASNAGLNENVLAARALRNTVWFATFEGLAHYGNAEGMTSHPLPSPGFVYDVLPLGEGKVLAATDGKGILRTDGHGGQWEELNGGEGTFYSLAADSDGKAWAVGPGTGFCEVRNKAAVGHGATSPPFDGDVYALAAYGSRLLAFGSSGTAAFDPRTLSITNVTSRLGLTDMSAELNAVAVDDEGSIWLATDQGLMRMRPREWHFNDRIPTVITSAMSGEVPLHIDHRNILPFDHDRIVLQFTGINWVDPGDVRFEYELTGRHQQQSVTRDREIAFTRLPAGDHTFRVRAFIGNGPKDHEWTTLNFTITPPLWQRPWVIGLVILFVLLILFIVVRSRERRLRERQRMEQEKVRFQLEAVRSQVDPHFLFNSFNTLVELIESDAPRAVGHVDKLSQFFRNILQVRDKEVITVDEELRLLENYFALEQHRFGDAISLNVEVSRTHREMFIVPLTLQLLVENCLKHNVATISEPLDVSVRSVDDELVVSNPVRPRLSAPRSTGFGLESIRKRYTALTVHPIRMERTADRFIVGIPLIYSINESPDHRG